MKLFFLALFAFLCATSSLANESKNDWTVGGCLYCYNPEEPFEFNTVAGFGYKGIVANWVGQNSAVYQGWELMYLYKISENFGLQNGIFGAYGRGSYDLENKNLDVVIGPTHFNSNYAKLGIVYSLLFIGAIYTQRDINKSLSYESGKKTLAKNDLQFLIGLGGVFELSLRK